MNISPQTFLSTGLILLLCSTLAISTSAAPATNQSTGVRQYAATTKPVWTDPDKVVALLRYDGIPLGEAAIHLRDQFKDQFDVVLPSTVASVNPTTGSPEPFDVQSVPVTLHLQNVKASEIFNGMNLFFAANGDPVRWELLMNGTRRTAVLQMAPVAVPASPRPAAEPIKRTVLFVGDIVEDGRPGKMSWREFSETVVRVCDQAFAGSVPTIATHPAASLLVVSGNQEQLEFVRNMLEALKEKARMDTERKAQSASGKAIPQSADSAK